MPLHIALSPKTQVHRLPISDPCFINYCVLAVFAVLLIFAISFYFFIKDRQEEENIKAPSTHSMLL